MAAALALVALFQLIDLLERTSDILARGGSVFYNYVSVRALSAMGHARIGGVEGPGQRRDLVLALVRRALAARGAEEHLAAVRALAPLATSIIPRTTSM